MQDNVGAGSSLKISENVRKLHGRANQVVAENFGGLHALSPICAALPGAHGRSACGRCNDVFQIEERGSGKVERSEARAGRGINELCVDDGVERYLHFEAVAGRMDEPDKAFPRLADVRDKVVSTDLGGYSSPRSNGEVRAGYDCNGCTFVQ